jgi:soluble lytic murein transglycosylase-like protein
VARDEDFDPSCRFFYVVVKEVLLLCIGVPVLVWSQTSDPYEAVHAAMAGSIQKQQASVRLQIKAAQLDEISFFTLPSLEPASTASIAVIEEPNCEPVPPEQIEPLIEEASRREGLTPDLLHAVIQRESAFRPCAVSHKGAQGLMQLMPATAAQFGVVDPFEPAQNISAGAKFLKQLLTRYEGDLALALGAYNAGPGRIDFRRTLPLLPETLDYVFEIQEMLQKVDSPSAMETGGQT